MTPSSSPDHSGVLDRSRRGRRFGDGACRPLRFMARGRCATSEAAPALVSSMPSAAPACSTCAAGRN
eukprot:11957115-Heterocapsa_arctica.AAC.1